MLVTFDLAATDSVPIFAGLSLRIEVVVHDWKRFTTDFAVVQFERLLRRESTQVN